MIVKARTIVTMDGAPLDNGAIWIEGRRIRAVGRFEELAAPSGESIVDLGESIVLPGLINAHCHLDYSMMRNAISPPKSFTAWVQRINALKRSLDSQDYLNAIAHGFKELRRWGTTTVCNIESFPELMPHMPPAPIRTWWFYEMIDVRHRITTDDVMAGALSFFAHHDNTLEGCGLSPHAPYTASPSLYELANECAAKMRMPLTTHVAESREEFAMFRHASGPLHEFMNAIQRPMLDCGYQTPFAHLWNQGAINGRWLLAHMNELAETDFELLATLGEDQRPHIVHCPGSHHYFGHSPFAFRRLHDLGFNLCVGTDSLASTDSLSLLREVRRLRESQPWMSHEQLLRTVTVNPARALQHSAQLGQIVPDALADLIAFQSSHTVGDVYEEIVAHPHPIAWMMIDGKIIP